jgi:hypothetical protein
MKLPRNHGGVPPWSPKKSFVWMNLHVQMMWIPSERSSWFSWWSKRSKMCEAGTGLANHWLPSINLCEISHDIAFGNLSVLAWAGREPSKRNWQMELHRNMRAHLSFLLIIYSRLFHGEKDWMTLGLGPLGSRFPSTSAYVCQFELDPR